ncbi:MAG: hypothetical protein KC583_01010, partial [Myxococcales bacterium]|nr:hypothetical protein [Myxococcales bacterium]
MASAAEQRLVVAAARQSPALLGWLMGWRPARVHFRFHDHLQAPRARGTAVARLHRGIGKTTQVAVAAAWEIGNNPSIRVKYVAQTDDESAKTTRLVRAIMGRPEYRSVFPSVRIDPRERSGHRFTVEVEGRAARDATLEAHGIFGRAGGRFDLLIVDDACDLRNAVQQPALREQVKEAFWNIWRPMADRSAPKPPRIWVVGTPWHVDDLLADLAAKYPEALLHEPVVGDNSPWPEVFDAEAIASLRADMPAAAFARAYELTPVSGEDLVFPEAWVKPCCRLEPPEAPGHHRIATIDWGFTERKRDGDPDYSVLLVGDRNPDGIVVLRRMLRMRADYPTFRDLAVAETARLGVRTIYAEANGPQKGLV